MSYQVLARKYRPSNFEELEGQEHVLRALANSLEHNRLHHAYLFTGTRGVGKTTIARILAKCLNCERGVAAKPCGECSTCLEIAEGRSVDLIEVDAASRTRIEDTRDLLDNVQYMPSRSRFKVYLIDEVHMLSNHSFNALLKTLEEPPEHVKFLLATTDPRKLPVTVLSRCLQFNLKNLSPERIVNHLKLVLDREEVDYEEAALWQLGRAADGSMRDALSLADQAISFGNNRLTDSDVRTMLGTIDQRDVYELIDALIERDALKLMERIAAMSEFAPDYEMLLAELLSVLHRVAVAQAVPDSVDNSQGDLELVQAVAGALDPEDVQLYYQIGLIGKRDLPLAPEPREGFEMVMLRMLSFVPSTRAERGGSDGEDSETVESGGETVRPANAAGTSPVADILSRIQSGETQRPAPEAGASSAGTATGVTGPQAGDASSDEIPWDDTEGVEQTDDVVEARPECTPEPSREPVQRSSQQSSQPDSPARDTKNPAVVEEAASSELRQDDWADIVEQLDIAGVTSTLASNCVLETVDGNRCILTLNEHHASLWNDAHEQRIAAALSRFIGRKVELRIEVGVTDRETPAEARERKQQAEREQAISAIENDANVRQLIETFDGKLNVDSIVPRPHAGE